MAKDGRERKRDKQLSDVDLKAAFLRAFADIPTPSHACREAGVTPAKYRQWMRDPEFQSMVRDAREFGVWGLYEVGWRMATGRFEEVLTHHGQVSTKKIADPETGKDKYVAVTVPKIFPAMTLAYLKAEMPERFGDKYTVDHQDNRPIHEIAEQLLAQARRKFMPDHALADEAANAEADE